MTSDLERALAARGAVFDTFHGLTLPAHFGDVGREWRAANEGAAVFAAGLRTLIAATGEDRVAFLQGMLSNDVKALTAGHGLYAAFLTQQGKVISDLRVYAEADRLLLDVVTWRREALQEGLEKFIVADDVELASAEQHAVLGVEGALARAVVGEALGVGELPHEPFTHRRVTFEGAELLVIAASEAERRGLLLCGPAGSAPALFAACVEAGAQPCGMQALDVLRVESGVPWAGVDIDETTLIMESGRRNGISFNKGCYLGQEVVERIAARGHVNRSLAGLIIDGDVLPAHRSRVLVGDQEVGYVTSPVRSEALQRPIAMAMVHHKNAAPGGRVAIDTGSGPASATVATLPFAAST